MKPLRTPALMIGTTLLVLTFLLVRGTTPDANLHERMLEALRGLTLNSATLQRDVMRARATMSSNSTSSSSINSASWRSATAVSSKAAVSRTSGNPYIAAEPLIL